MTISRIFVIEKSKDSGRTWEPMIASVDAKLSEARSTLAHVRDNIAPTIATRIAEYRRTAIVNEK